jgi:hypothetical protein
LRSGSESKSVIRFSLGIDNTLDGILAIAVVKYLLLLFIDSSPNAPSDITLSVLFPDLSSISPLTIM